MKIYLTRDFKMSGSRKRSSERDMLPVEDQTVTFEGLAAPVKEVLYMPTGQPLGYKLVDSKLTVRVPASSRGKMVDIVRVTFEEK